MAAAVWAPGDAGSATALLAASGVPLVVQGPLGSISGWNVTNNDPRTIDAIFSAAAECAGEMTHLVLPETDVTATYQETMQRARRLAALLVARGVEPGDRVACFMGNRRELYEFFVGVSLAGAVAVPINSQTAPNEVRRLLADCLPKVIIADEAIMADMGENPFSCLQERFAVGGSISEFDDLETCLCQHDAIEGARSAPTDPCLIIYSSGTTGNPKGIMLQHERLVRNARAVIRRLDYSSSDVFLAVLPSFHLFGYSFDFMYSGLVHGTLVAMPAFDPESALGLIEKYRVSVIAGVPTMFARMFDASLTEGRDLSSLRLLDVGGGPVSPTLKRRLQNELGINVVESYGLTEISTVAAVARPHVPVPEGSCGMPLEDFHLRVVNDHGIDVATGEAGELWFRCDTFMHGYWNQPELTATTLEDGWLRTGDIGKVDEQGNVYILDRKKDMIVSNGFNVFPKEVENACVSHPAVLSAAVVGTPDEIKGEVIHALVVLKAGSKCSGEEILEHCARELARYKQPRSLSIIEELPLTVTGKIRRFQLRDIALAEIRSGRSITLRDRDANKLHITSRTN